MKYEGLQQGASHQNQNILQPGVLVVGPNFPKDGIEGEHHGKSIYADRDGYEEFHIEYVQVPEQKYGE
jgi:hypothetical protein